MDVFIVLVCIKQSSPLFGKLQFQGYCRHGKRSKKVIQGYCFPWHHK